MYSVFSIIAFVICLMVAAEEVRSGPATIISETLRTYQTERDTFDYVFTAYTANGNGSWKFALNHRTGNTTFTSVGETVGTCSIAGFEPIDEREFVPSVNAWRARKSGRLTLKNSQGKQFILRMGQPLQISGWRATVVSTTSGTVWSVREGDLLHESEIGLSITLISPEKIIATFNGHQLTIPPITPRESSDLAELWQQQRDVQQQKLYLASQRHIEKIAEPKTPGNTIVATKKHTWPPPPVLQQPGFFYGTEYSYPTEYQIIMLPRGPNGTLQPLLIPKAFETRTTRGYPGIPAYRTFSPCK